MVSRTTQRQKLGKNPRTWAHLFFSGHLISSLNKVWCDGKALSVPISAVLSAIMLPKCCFTLMVHLCEYDSVEIPRTVYLTEVIFAAFLWRC